MRRWKDCSAVHASPMLFAGNIEDFFVNIFFRWQFCSMQEMTMK